MVMSQTQATTADREGSYLRSSRTTCTDPWRFTVGMCHTLNLASESVEAMVPEMRHRLSDLVA